MGRPNVGKSTLLNAILGQKLAIATSRPQTTRHCMLGVHVVDEPKTQIAFVDTPGMHRPHNALGRAMQENAKSGLDGTHVVVLLTEVSGSTRAEDFLDNPEDREVLSVLKTYQGPVILGINKVDRIKQKEELFPILEAAEARNQFASLVPLAARRGKGLPGLFSEIRKHLPEGLSYPEDLLTDKPEKFFVAELVREAVMLQTQKEVPYSIAVTIDHFEDTDDMARVHASIVVPKDSHKGIIIGKGGQRLKEIGTAARIEAEEILGRKLFLKLWVKVVPDWTNQPGRVRDLVQEEVK